MSVTAHHLKITAAMLARYVIVCGSSSRAKEIADQLDKKTFYGNPRKMDCFTGYWRGIKVTVITHGMGPASMGIIVDEIKDLAKEFGVLVTVIRIGTGAAIDSKVKVGDMVIASSATRDESTTNAYAPIGVAAEADHFVTHALIQAATQRGYRFHVGQVHTKSALGKETGRWTPMIKENRAYMQQLRHLFIKASSMEAAVLFILAMFGVEEHEEPVIRAGTALHVIGDEDNPFVENAPGQDKVVEVVFGSIEILEEQRLAA
jgi:uridine phosphorylase